MASVSKVLLNQRRESFEALLSVWDRRLRRQQAVIWLPRSLLPGLLFGIILAAVSRLRPFLLPTEVLTATAAALLAGVLMMLLAAFLWRRPLTFTARRFDDLFGLQERLSTAWELMEGRIHAGFELTVRQLDDTWGRARSIQPNEALPLIWNWREWLSVAFTALLLGVLLILPNANADRITQNDLQSAAIRAAGDDLREVTQEIASDTSLDSQQREQLLQTLERSSETLREEDLSVEEAFAALADAEAPLEEQANLLNEQANAQASAFERAQAALQSIPQMEEQQEIGEGTQQGQAFQQMLDNLADNLEGLNDQQLQQTADALQQAAQQLESVNPEAAQALREAAEALQNGDLDQATQALQEAQNQLQQSLQEQSQQMQAAQMLQQATQQVQQAAAEVSQQGQQGQTGDDNSILLQEPQQGQQGQEGQTGQQAQVLSSQGQSQGANPAGALVVPGGQQGQQGQQQGQQAPGAANSLSGAGAGDDPGGEGSDDGGLRSGQNPIQQNNNPDGEGVGEFEPVFAPRRVGPGQSDDQIVLEPDSSDVPVVEGDFSENPEGDVTVPYSEVFSDYNDAANRALESDYIPLGLRDVVRDYFSSLEPRQRQGGS